MIVKFLDDNNPLATFKKQSQLKRYRIWNFYKFKVFFKIFNFQKSFTTWKWGVCAHWHTKQNCNLWYKKKKKGVELTYFGMIQNYDKFSKWDIEFGKIYTLWKIHIYSTMINTKQVIY